jgi:hypothetical protein
MDKLQLPDTGDLRYLEHFYSRNPLPANHRRDQYKITSNVDDLKDSMDLIASKKTGANKAYLGSVAGKVNTSGSTRGLSHFGTTRS